VPKPPTPDRPDDLHAAISCRPGPDRRHLDHKAFGIDVDLEGRVVQGARLPSFSEGSESLEDSAVPSHRSATGAQGKPVQQDTSTLRWSHCHDRRPRDDTRGESNGPHDRIESLTVCPVVRGDPSGLVGGQCRDRTSGNVRSGPTPPSHHTKFEACERSPRTPQDPAQSAGFGSRLVPVAPLVGRHMRSDLGHVAATSRPGGLAASFAAHGTTHGSSSSSIARSAVRPRGPRRTHRSPRTRVPRGWSRVRRA